MMSLNNYIEHTNLRPDSSKFDIEKLAREAIEYSFFGICVNPNYVSFAKELLEKTDIKIVSVVNFPLANNKIETTLNQVQMALADGAEEIDTVLNLSALKNKDYKKVEYDIKKTKEETKNYNLKVILETDLLSKEEIVIASKCAVNAGANFVKTSTGFVKNSIGATVENVKLMYKTVSPFGVEVKASGGIKNYESAIKLIDAGANRLGTSSGVEIIKRKV